jgi:uncharacterized membrane protein YgcG
MQALHRLNLSLILPRSFNARSVLTALSGLTLIATALTGCLETAEEETSEDDLSRAAVRLEDTIAEGTIEAKASELAFSLHAGSRKLTNFSDVDGAKANVFILSPYELWFVQAETQEGGVFRVPLPRIWRENLTNYIVYVEFQTAGRKSIAQTSLNIANRDELVGSKDDPCWFSLVDQNYHRTPTSGPSKFVTRTSLRPDERGRCTGKDALFDINVKSEGLAFEINQEVHPAMGAPGHAILIDSAGKLVHLRGSDVRPLYVNSQARIEFNTKPLSFQPGPLQLFFQTTLHGEPGPRRTGGALQVKNDGRILTDDDMRGPGSRCGYGGSCSGSSSGGSSSGGSSSGGSSSGGSNGGGGSHH